ncbi:hypothetical protein EVAR_28433_1 [Eumeta japonica]|uniref:Uncharacterized protein n=1 Tax=Eumeta variegata TaxID=151549 RepID=A0A4C1V7W4_EUMVA|nr:hypothetical protein EVAR_28433_1 [Eumeta japonica]
MNRVIIRDSLLKGNETEPFLKRLIAGDQNGLLTRTSEKDPGRSSLEKGFVLDYRGYYTQLRVESRSRISYTVGSVESVFLEKAGDTFVASIDTPDRVCTASPALRVRAKTPTRNSVARIRITMLMHNRVKRRTVRSLKATIDSGVTRRRRRPHDTIGTSAPRALHAADWRHRRGALCFMVGGGLAEMIL